MHASFSAQKQKERISNLEIEIAELQQTLGKDEDADAIVKRHIHLLHRYNEAKDATQLLIGRLASLRQTTVRQIHEELVLDTTD